MAKYYISTPIYYINAKAHIGTAYTTIASDVLARYRRQQGDSVLFTTGTDENSQKTVKAASAAGMDVGEYVDQMAVAWKQLFDSLNISYDQFVRTTEDRHLETVYAVFEKIQAAGDIYKDTYKGYYCVDCESFVTTSELVDGKCPVHQRPPQTVEEQNYFFKLSKYQDALLAHINDNPDFIKPESRRNEVVSFIKQGLSDFSISREGKTWGIPYPFDPDHTIYVWVEALMNYLTVTGYPKAGYEQWWPADVHMMGKDIIKFHCVYWPAILMSAGLPLPKTVMAHGFLTVSGTKISKSLGNAIDPLQIAQEYGVDALRYILLKATPFGQDGDFSMERFVSIYNSELADDLGNLASRVSAMIQKYQNGAIIPAADPAHDTANYHQAMSDYRFDKALEVVSSFVKDLNLYIEQEKPWEIAKTDSGHVAEVLSYLAVNLQYVGKLLEPFMPDTSQKLQEAFGGPQLKPFEGSLFPKYHE